MKDFLECTALITGASAGIGREIAVQLAPLAGTLILVARRTDRLESLRAELLAINPTLRVECHTVDLSVPAQVDVLCHTLAENAVELDFLINNAGFGDSGAFETSEWSKIERMLQVNIIALTALCHRSDSPAPAAPPRGAILNVSSIASLLPIPNLGVYAATKAYVSSFSEALRAELRGTGISVTHLCPGPVDTEFQDVAARQGEAASKHAPDWGQGPGAGSGPRGVAGGVARPGADRPRILDDDGTVFLCAGATIRFAVGVRVNQGRVQACQGAMLRTT